MSTWKNIAAALIACGALLAANTAFSAPNCPGHDKSAKKKKGDDDKGDGIVETACPGSDKSAKKKKGDDDKGDGLI